MTEDTPEVNLDEKVLVSFNLRKAEHKIEAIKLAKVLFRNSDDDMPALGLRDAKEFIEGKLFLRVSRCKLNIYTRGMFFYGELNIFDRVKNV